MDINHKKKYKAEDQNQNQTVKPKDQKISGFLGTCHLDILRSSLWDDRLLDVHAVRLSGRRKGLFLLRILCGFVLGAFSPQAFTPVLCTYQGVVDHATDLSQDIQTFVGQDQDSMGADSCIR